MVSIFLKPFKKITIILINPALIDPNIAITIISIDIMALSDFQT